MTDKHLVSSPNTNSKENCSSSSKQLTSTGVTKQDSLFFNFDKLNTAAITPNKTKLPNIRNLASKMDGFTRSTNEMNHNARRTPTKDHKNEGKGSGIKSPTYGLLEKVRVGKEEDVVFDVKAKPLFHCTDM